MHLDCGSCIVRDWRDGDRESLERFADNRRVWRNLKDRFPHPYTTADAAAWIALTRVHAKMAHIGYWLGEPFWGRGIVTDAVRAVSELALERLGFLRVEAPVFAWNPASMRVLEKCGFARVAPG